MFLVFSKQNRKTTIKFTEERPEGQQLGLMRAAKGRRPRPEEEEKGFEFFSLRKKQVFFLKYSRIMDKSHSMGWLKA